MSLSFSTLLVGDDVHVLDVSCSCARGTVEDEATSAFEVVFPTAGMYRRNGGEIDAASVYVGRPECEQRIEHVTDGDRCVLLLLSERVADELGLDRFERQRTRAHDRLVAGAARTGEEAWLEALTDPSPAAAPVREEHRRAVARVREAIAASPGSAWTLRSLATVAGYAPHHLSRVFRACTGTTVTEHRDRVRLACALTLARDGLPLADVAAATGFADHAHLTRRCRHVLGEVPSQLR